MNFFKIIYKPVLVLLLITSNILIAQEQLRPLSSNMNLAITPRLTSLSKTTTTITPLNLPFFDDFSYSYKSPYPSSSYWLDSSTYVNSSFAIAPISLGVATFDGLNKHGYPYAINAPVNFSGSSDTLTSNPINLKATSTHTYSASDSVFISFYYQAEGFGDAPEANDSLCLDFFKPSINKWSKVWGVKGYNPSATDTNFYRVKIAITDPLYFDSLFQFRFRNKATTSGSLDHWNLDYIQLKHFYYYNDTLLDDVAFAYKPSSFLKNYSVMPYNQYNRTLEMGPKFRNFIRSNFNIPKFSSYNYSVKDEFNVTVATDVYGTFDNPGILPFVNNGYYPGNAAVPVFTLQPFANTFSDSTFYTIQHVLTTSGDAKKSNDTLVHVQKFSNYYAYDDGSAEVGYYLNTYGAKTAVRFTLNAADTLRSVRIYFDPIIEGTLIQGSSFRVMVWGTSGNVPGNVIYKDSLTYPEYLSGSYNKMPTYQLTSCLPLGVGSYFIGIQQTTNQPLNIGFDKNTNHKESLFYDIGNGWIQSAIPGSLMINPVMGCTYAVPVSINEQENFNKIKIFPNPTQNTFQITYPGNQLEKSDLEVFNSYGQLVLKKSIISNETIDASSLSNGLYLIQLKVNNINVSSQKLIITK